jgi:type II secretory pathway pseudopilin PulG
MKKLNQRGAVAMISVVIFSILITILVTAYARTIVSQQRNAINYDLSTRAYYAAESGVQDAIRALKTDASLLDVGQPTCKSGTNTFQPNTSNGSLGGSEDYGYTCQIISTVSEKIPVNTGTGTSIVRINPFKLDVAQDYDLVITWASGSGVEKTARPSVEGKLFPDTSAWSGSGYYPVLRTTFISMGDTGPVSRSNIKQNVYFLNPAEAADSSIGLTPEQTQDSSTVVRDAVCSNIECKATFKVNSSTFAGKALYLATNSIYEKGVLANLQIIDSSGENVDLVGFAEIDVTGRAGNVFRRVKQVVDMSGGDRANYIENTFDSAALVVGDGICKLFTVGNTPNQYVNNCPNK